MVWPKAWPCRIDSRWLAWFTSLLVWNAIVDPIAGAQLAVTRRYWRCVHLLERALGVPAEQSQIPKVIHEPPEGWAMGLAASEPGQRRDMPMHPFYWKAFEKGACQTEPPEGSKRLTHQGDGTFA